MIGAAIKLSIVIVNWNTRQILVNCLTSIVNSPPSNSFEVIVVDNGSTDGSVEAVATLFPHFTIISNSENLGFAKANNVAFGMARGSFILMLNSDTIVSPGSLDGAVEYIQKNSKIGALGVKLLNRDGSLQPSALRCPTPARNFAAALTRNLTPLKKYAKRFSAVADIDYDQAHVVEYVRGAFLLFGRNILEEVGGLDENYFMYGEEADFCLRIREKGYYVVYWPGVTIVHLGGGSSKSAPDSTVLRRSFSAEYFIMNHSPFYQAWFFCILRLTFRAFLGLNPFASSRNRRLNRNRARATSALLRRVVRNPGSWSA